MEKIEQKIKTILKSEIVPFLVGLRNEVKELTATLKKKKEIPDIQKTEITNPIKFPDTQKVEVINPIEKVEITNPQKKVEVKDLPIFLKSLKDTIYPIGHILLDTKEYLKGAFEKLSDTIFRVKVENPQEIQFPEIQKVEVINPPEEKQVQKVIIENSSPQEAIPVVLTDSERKRFYTAISQMMSGGSYLGGVKKILSEIEVNTREIEINADTLNLNIDELEGLAGKTLRRSFGEVSVNPSTETEITNLTVQAGKKLRIKGIFCEGVVDGIFRLYLNSNKVWQGRNAWTQRNINSIIEIEGQAGDVFSLKVEHNFGAIRTFSGSLYAFEYD